MPRKDGDRLGARPALYAATLVAVVLVAWAGKRGADGIFACQAKLYTLNRYLAYCDAPGYGDYDHGAVWFDLEPAVREHAATADVLFLGDSRMQFGFSTRATADWFSASRARYYLWGFAYSENAVFARALLDKAQPKARVYVINVDPFFEQSETEPAKVVLHGSGAAFRYQQKRLWQLLHEAVCGEAPVACRNRYAIFRTRDNGAWSFSGAERYSSTPVSHVEAVNEAAIDRYKTSGQEFLSRLPVRRDCVILTLIPRGADGFGTNRDTAEAIARALQMDLVAPDLDGLETFDGTHLAPPSAERWSAAFFSDAAPRIRKCLDQPLETRSGAADRAASR